MSKESSVRELPREKVAVSDTPLGQSAQGPEHQDIDKLQNLADQSSGVKQTEKTASLANAQVNNKDTDVVEDPGEWSVGAVMGKAGEMALKGKTVAAGAGLAAAATKEVQVDQSNLTNDILTGVQHVSQFVYSARDFYEKKDWKSGAACFLDIAKGLLALEEKIKVTGLAPDFIPVIGGAISGLRQWDNLSRVDDSMKSLEKVMGKIKLEKGDEKIIKAFKKEQQINKIKHGAQAIIAFASMAAPLIPGGLGQVIFGVLQGIIPAISTIRDQWINYVESTANKAKAQAEKRLGVEESKGQSKEDLSEINEIMVQESKNNALVGSGLVTEDSLTGKNFSIRKLTETYHALEGARAELKAKDPSDQDYEEMDTKVKELERGLNAAISDYNFRMGKMTNKYFKKHFTPATLENVKKLHDYHLLCIHNIMKDGKERQDARSKKGFFGQLVMKEEQKEKIIQELYGGKIPEPIDIKLAEMTVDTQDYFWGKTETEIGNSLLEVQKSKATLVADMSKILKRNKQMILDNMHGDGKLFQSEDNFDSDLKIVVNTLNL